MDAMKLAVAITADPTAFEQGIGRVLAVARGLEPALNGGTDELSRLAQEAEKAANSTKKLGGSSSHLASLTKGLSTLKAKGTELTDVLSSATQAFQGITGAIQKVYGSASKLTSVNAQFETFGVQLGVLMKGTDGFAKGVERANQRMEELTTFAAETPFEMQEIVEAEKMLMTFGFTAEASGDKVGQSLDAVRTAIGDTASMTSATFGEMATYFGRLSTGGSIGEVLTRFTELGIATRDELAEMGIAFDNQGGLADKSAEGVKKLTSTMLELMQSKFGGGMKEQAKTWDGLTSTLKDNLSLMKQFAVVPIFDELKTGLQWLVSFTSAEPVWEMARAIGEMGAAFLRAFGRIGSALGAVDTDGIMQISEGLTSGLGAAQRVVESFSAAIVGILDGPLGSFIALVASAGAGLIALGLLAAPILSVGGGLVKFFSLGGTEAGKFGKALGIITKPLGWIAGLLGSLAMPLALAAGGLALVAREIMPLSDWMEKIGFTARSLYEAFTGLGNTNWAVAFDGTPLEPFASGMEKIEFAVGRLGEKFQMMPDVLNPFVEAFGTLFAGDLGTTVDHLVTGFSQLGGWMANVGETVLPALSAGFSELASNAIPMIVEALGSIGEKLMGFGEAALGALPGVIEVLSSLGTTLMESLGAVAESLKPLVAGAFEWLGTFFADLGTWLGENTPVILEALGVIIDGLISWGVEAGLRLWEMAVGWVTSMGSGMSGSVGTLLSGAAVLIESIYGFVANVKLLLISKALEWGLALIGWVGFVLVNLPAMLVNLSTTIASWVLGMVPVITDLVLNWATAFLTWIGTAAGQVAGMLGVLIGTIVRWLIGAVPQLLVAGVRLGAALIRWLVEIVPKAIVALAQLIARLVTWIVTNGIPLLIDAGIKIGGGLVRGFLSGLKGELGGGGGGGGGGMLSRLGAMFGNVPKTAEKASRSGWDWLKANQAAKVAEANQRTEQELMRGEAKAARASKAIGQSVIDGLKEKVAGIKDAAGAAGAAADVAGAMAGGGGGGGGGGEGGESGGGGGGGGAGEDPVAKAMETINSVTGALNSVLDFAEKAFNFRGFPPPEVMDELFAGLEKILDRAIELSKGISLEEAELASSVAQMAQGFIGALTGLVDLADKLARWRPPTAESLAVLDQMMVWLLKLALRMTEMVMKGSELEATLANLSVGQKVAEMLGAWVEVLKSMAEATQAMARARWDTDLAPVSSFLTKLVEFVIKMTDELTDTFGQELRILLLNTRDLGETLKPWVDLWKTVAETVDKLARSRWPKDLSRPLEFVSELADFAFDMMVVMRQRLGPMILVALEDTRLIAETLGPWIDAVSKIGAAANGLHGVRWPGGEKLAAPGAFIDELFGLMVHFQARAKQVLGNGILVALEDIKLIGEAFAPWLDAFGKIADVLSGTDRALALVRTRSNVFFNDLFGFLANLLAHANLLLGGAYEIAGETLLFVAEDSKAIAEGVGAWLDVFAKLLPLFEATDKALAIVRTRSEVFVQDLGPFLLNMLAWADLMTSGAIKAVGDRLPQVVQDTAAVAGAMGAWVDVFAKVNTAIEGVDKALAFIRARRELDVGTVANFLIDLANSLGWLIVDLSSRNDPGAMQAFSQQVAQTFGAWLGVFAQVSQATESIRRMKVVSTDKVDAAADFLTQIAFRMGALIVDIRDENDAGAAQTFSQQVAATFKAWVDVFSQVSKASEAISQMPALPEGKLDEAADVLTKIAFRMGDLIVHLMEAANPTEAQQFSQTVAKTFDAWLGVFSKAADVTRSLADVVAPTAAELGAVSGLIEQVVEELTLMSSEFQSMEDLKREELVAALADYVGIASAAVDLFGKAAGLGRALYNQTTVNLGDVMRVTQNIMDLVVEVETMAKQAPELESAAKRWAEGIKTYISVAGPALDLFKKGADIGKDLYDVVALDAGNLTLVKEAITQIVDTLGPMAEDWANAQRRMESSVAKIQGFSVAAKAALDLIKPTVEILTKLAEETLTPLKSSDLGMVKDAMGQIVAMARELSVGFEDARGELDETAVKNIAGFASAAGSAVGLVGATVDTMVKLHQATGMLGGLTESSKAQIRTGLTGMIDLVAEIAGLYNAGNFEADKAREKLVEFSQKSAALIQPLGQVVDVLDKVYKFAYSVSDTGRREEIVREFGEHVRDQLVHGIGAMVSTIAQVMDDLGPEAVAQAKLVAEKVGPVADTIGKMLEPIDKLLNNPFVDNKRRSNFSAKVAQNRIKHLADNVAKGIQHMAKALITGLKDVKVPAGIDAAMGRLITVVNGLVDVMAGVMGMPDLDPNKIAEFALAAALLVSTLGGVMGSMGGTPPQIGTAASGGSNSWEPPYGAAPYLPPQQQPGYTPPFDPGQPVTLTGTVTANGGVVFTGPVNQTVEIDGEVLQQTQRNPNTTAGTNREGRTAPPA